MRIVSLVPAGTDIVHALGLGDALVGVSHECAPVRADVPRLTRSLVDTAPLSSTEIDAAVSAQAASGAPMYEVDSARLAALRPDVVITQSLCNVCALPGAALDAALEAFSPRPDLITLDGRTIDAMLDAIQRIGASTGCPARATVLVRQLRARLAAVAAAVAGRPARPALCLEWIDPPFTCGHWIPEMVARAGGQDLVGRAGEPSTRISWREIERLQPSLVVAMPCGYDLACAVYEVAAVAVLPEWRRAVGNARVFVAAGGAYFTRPGPALVTGVELLASVLHPDVVTWTLPTHAIVPWRLSAASASAGAHE